MRFLIGLLAVCIVLVVGRDAFAASRFVGEPPTDGNRKPRLLVFVHGLGNNGIGGTFRRSDDILSAWKRDPDNVDWPAVFKNDQSIATNFDVFLVQYDTAKLRNTVSIQSISDDVRNDLQRIGEIARYGEVFFIAHSLGGLVTRELLLRNDEIREKTRALFMFSVPMGGSTVATLAAKFGIAGNQTVQLGAEPDNPDTVFNSIKSRWISLGITIPTFCAYETRDTYQMRRVVTRSSAEYLCTHALEEIDGDHNEIVLPNRGETFRAHDKLWAWMDRLGLVTDANSREESPERIVVANCRGTYAELGPYRNIHAELPRFINSRRRLFPTAYPSEPLASIWQGNNYRYMIYKKIEPRFVIIHRSCFQNLREDQQHSDENRDRWFFNFLHSFRDTSIRFIVYSRTFQTVAECSNFYREFSKNVGREFAIQRLVLVNMPGGDRFSSESPFENSLRDALSDRFQESDGFCRRAS